MSNDIEIFERTKKKFDETKKDLGFKVSFEEVDGIFFISDAAANAGFVSEKAFSRQLCSRIVETYMRWNDYLHNLIMSNPHYLIQMQESKALNEEDRKKISKLIGKAMALVSENSLIGLTKNKIQEGKFIDESVKFWNETYKPELIYLIDKIHDGWKK